MKITGLTVHVFQKRPQFCQETESFQLEKTIQNGVAVIHTDEGIDGIICTHLRDLIQMARQWAAAREYIEGQDPLNRGKIQDILTNRFWWSGKLYGALDFGLWDIAGKYFKLPVYKLLGATREKVLAYGSTIHHGKDENFIQTVLACKEKGYKAIKIHPYCVADDDIRLCYKVRKAVGDEMILMIDPISYPGPYNRPDAMRVGKVLDELNFWWFEDPLDKRDLDGLAELARTLKVQIRVSDRVEDIREYSYMIQHKCMDIVAGVTSLGITTLMKISHIAEVNSLGFEPHDYSGATASLHVLLAVNNARFYETSVPVDWYENLYPGVYIDPIKVDKEGYIQAPKKPGLSFDVDWNEAKKVTEQVIQA